MLIKSSGAAVEKPRPAKSYFVRRTELWDRKAYRGLQKFRAIMRALDLRPGQRVLDVACGTGELFPWLLSRDPAFDGYRYL